MIGGPRERCLRASVMGLSIRRVPRSSGAGPELGDARKLGGDLAQQTPPIKYCLRVDRAGCHRVLLLSAVCPDLVDKYLEETSIHYMTPRTHSSGESSTEHMRSPGKSRVYGHRRDPWEDGGSLPIM